MLPAFTGRAIASYGHDCALLAFARAPRRVRRVMRETGLLAPHRVGRTAAKPHDGTITTDKVNEMWGTDMTQTDGLKLRHDHGSNYMSGDFQDEIEFLGIEASPSFVREPQGNGVAERFEFATRYNETWLVARHGYRTPAKVRADQCRIDQNATADLKLAA